jgi:hypothetical protein
MMNHGSYALKGSLKLVLPLGCLHFGLRSSKKFLGKFCLPRLVCKLVIVPP